MSIGFKISKEQKKFYKALFALVIPITIQNFISSAVNSADVLMLDFVGQSELAAVSLANQFQFLLWGFFYGINSGVTMLGSQYWGKKDTDSIQAVMGIAIKISIVITVILSFSAVVFPKELMRIYTNDEKLVEIGASYLSIVGISYVLLSFSQVYMSTLRSMERVKTSTVISSIALILNVTLNAMFIFGLLGLPKLGVLGVSYATLISRVVETALCMMDAARARVFKINLKLMFGHHKLLFKDFIKYATPALGNDLLWTIAFSSYAIILGHINGDMVAAGAVASTVRELCTIVCFAIAGGASVLLGIKIGEGRMEETKKYAVYACRTTFVIGIITGLIILAIRPIVFMGFNLSAQAHDYLNIMLFISSYYVLGQAMNTLLIAGIFRAGGDSRFGLFCDIITMWVVSVPLGFFSAFVLKLPPMVVYFILCLDEFWKIPVVYKHYKSFKWLKNITRDLE